MSFKYLLTESVEFGYIHLSISSYIFSSGYCGNPLSNYLVYLLGVEFSISLLYYYSLDYCYYIFINYIDEVLAILLLYKSCAVLVGD